MSWKPIGPGQLQVDWSADSGAALSRCDPYLVWQDAIARDTSTDDAAFGEIRDVCVLIEKNAKEDPLDDLLLRNDIHLNHGHQIDETTFVTVYMPLATATASLRRLVEAVHRGQIKRFTLQTARRLAGLVDPQGNLGLMRKRKRHTAPGSALQSFWSRKVTPRVKPVIGIIDDACPFTNTAFWDGNQPRLTALWQQDGGPSSSGDDVQGKGTGSGGATPAGDDLWAPIRRRDTDDLLARPGSGETSASIQEVVLFAHGRELAVDRLGALRERGEHSMRRTVDRAAPDSRGRRAAGASIGPRSPAATDGAQIPPAPPLPRASHGSHVMSIAAAVPEPSTLRHLAPEAKHSLPVAFVQLPRQVVDDTSSRSLAAHALDGIHYLLDHAGDDPLVVNLSYGTYAGPHDGGSMFERALVELLRVNPNLHVVLPAGNSHLRQGHVHGRLHGNATAGEQREQRLYWRVLPDDPTDGYLEIWFPPDVQAAIHIKPPGHATPFRLAAGDAYLLKEDDGQIVFGGIYAREVAQGEQGTMALIAVSPTRRVQRQKESGAARPQMLGSLLRYRDESLAPHGTWEVVIENLGAEAFDFDAWIERDDAAPYMRSHTQRKAGRQSYFLDWPAGAVSPEGTLSGIATASHARLHVVGAMQRGSSLRGGGPLPLMPCLSDYSSAGPNRGGENRSEGPDVVTLADDTRALPGLLGSGLMSGSRQRMNGTSVAAAVYTRMLAAHLASGGNADAPIARPLGVADPGCKQPGSAGRPRQAFPLQRGWGRRVLP